ncbi:MAG: hypothetical protein AB1589_39585 [Cyanobacteriota bacterium]
MPSNPDSQIVFRDVKLAKTYDDNFGRVFRNQQAKIDIKRYQFLIKKSMPKLSEEEAIALWVALNDADTTHTEALPKLLQSVTSKLIECGQIKLARRVEKWSLWRWFAVVDGCDRVDSDKHQIKNLAAELRKVGLY